MENKVIVTTTNSIENAEVEKYIDLISTNVVVGTNLFSDFGASLTDLFGGLSDSYQGKLQKIYSLAIDNLKLKAANVGANAILGLKIDFDEISGKGKSMFMISAIGTAVILKFDSKGNQNESLDDTSIITKERLEKEVTKRKIISDIEKNKLPNQDEWIYLLNNPIEEISERLIDIYLSKLHVHSNEWETDLQLLLSNTPNYFRILNKEIAINILYKKLVVKPIPILEMISANNLFSANKIIKLIQDDNIDIAVDCLKANMDYYSDNDLILMEKISEMLNNLPDKGKIDNVKGMLGKAKEKFICPNGHTNDVENNFCTTYECGKNIKGINAQQFQQIEKFKIKVDSLSNLIESNN